MTSIRLVAAAKGSVIAANMWGKVKTVTQIVAICVIFALQTVMDIISLATDGVAYSFTEYGVMKAVQSMNPSFSSLLTCFDVFNIIGQVLLWIVAIITVISGVKYVVDNKEVISDM